MPHLERSIFPWQNGCYPADRKNSDQVTPWIEAFVNALAGGSENEINHFHFGEAGTLNSASLLFYGTFHLCQDFR